MSVDAVRRPDPELEAVARRFTRRLIVREEPEVAAELEQLAADAGRSLAAEIRAACRWWIEGHK